MSKYVGIVKQRGQMNWEKIMQLKVEANSIEEATEKFNKYIESKKGHSQYIYTLLKVKEV